MGSSFKTFSMAGSSRTSLSKDLGISSNNNFPPELVERMNKAPKHRFTSPFETSSGGFVPYTSMTRRSASWGATTLRSNPTVAHVSEHSPSIFPVKETRFYKPKLHTKNFMNPEEDDE